MDKHADVVDLLGAWALDAMEADEAAAVEAHLDVCVACAVQARRLRAATGWLGADQVSPAPPALRDSVLATARAARAPVVLRTLVGAYAAQVAHLDQALAELGPAGWRQADPRHDSVGGIVAHLAGNDARLAADLGLPAAVPSGTGLDIDDGRAVKAAWRAQTEVLRRGLAGGADLTRPVRLAGSGDPTGPLRDALVQRAFETWIHLDDIALATHRPLSTPPPEQVRRIVDLAVGVLPTALRAHGASRPGRAARLALTGPAGGTWTVPLDTGPPGDVAVTITTDAVEFARLVANRRGPGTLRHTVAGDRALAAELLRVAATLGCD